MSLIHLIRLYISAMVNKIITIVQNFCVMSVGILMPFTIPGHLSINHEKMSKSIGNVISVDKMLESYSADVFRLFALSTSLGKGK